MRRGDRIETPKGSGVITSVEPGETYNRATGKSTRDAWVTVRAGDGRHWTFMASELLAFNRKDEDE